MKRLRGAPAQLAQAAAIERAGTVAWLRRAAAQKTDSWVCGAIEALAGQLERAPRGEWPQVTRPPGRRAS